MKHLPPVHGLDPTLLCLPWFVSSVEDAWYFGNTTLGSPINNITAEVYVHTARWISDPTKTATVVHVLTENECTPVLSGFHGVAPGGQDRILASLVGNYEAKIDDVSVFDVPSACQGL